MGKIFQRQRLTATQLRTVAEVRGCGVSPEQRIKRAGERSVLSRRFCHRMLVESEVAGGVSDDRLDTDPARLSKADREIRDLVFRSHDLASMLARLPGLTRKMAATSGSGEDALGRLRKICGEWT